MIPFNNQVKLLGNKSLISINNKYLGKCGIIETHLHSINHYIMYLKKEEEIKVKGTKNFESISLKKLNDLSFLTNNYVPISLDVSVLL